jgi:hypothetical protein
MGRKKRVKEEGEREYKPVNILRKSQSSDWDFLFL